jgi:glycosyltransferase involved in cell wall biosynthesis
MLARVLLVYSSKPPTISYLQHAFARLGIDARCLFADQNTLFDRHVIHRINKLAHNLRIIPKSKNFLEHHPLAHTNYRSALLEQSIRSFDPDLVFLVRGIGFRPSALQGARTKFAWWVEAEERVDEPLRELPDFDWYFFINSSCVAAAQSAGHRSVSYLSHAVDATLYRPLPGVAKEFDFCFVGTWSEKRQRFMEAALDISGNGAIYGPKWRKKTWRNAKFRSVVRGSYIEGGSLVDLFNRSRIVVNVTDWGRGEGRGRSGMTMRIFEVPATGAFLLTDASSELGSVVAAGEQVGTFEGVKDFSTQFRFYLNNEPLRERMAANAMHQVRANHSYDRMASTIVDRYNEVISRAGRGTKASGN